MYQIGYYPEMNASRHPERTAIVFGGVEVSWKDLNRDANKLAHGMTAAGVRKGDVVAYYMRNSYELVLIWWATQKIGAIAQPVNCMLLEREIAKCLNASGCSVLFYQGTEHFDIIVEGLTEKCPSIGLFVRCGEGNGRHARFEDLMATTECRNARTDISETDGSLLLFTSGSEGEPKGVLRSQRIVRDYALMLAMDNENTSTPETLVTLCPMFHTAGISLLLKMAILGGTLVLFDGFDPKGILDAVDAYRATQMLLIPPSLYCRLADARSEAHDLSTLKEAQCSGGGVSEKEIGAMRSLFPNASFRFSWGSTETCAPTSAVISYEELGSNPGLHRTIGKLNSMVEMKLITEDGGEAAVGEHGEALVRSSMVFSGYLHDEEKTKEVLDSEGWYRTGDILKRDERGYYYLVDRKKDMIKSGGENVYAFEVETVLNDHPQIKECAVVGIPDVRFGEAVAAVIATVDGNPLDANELADYCRRNMAGFKKPRYAAYVESLPRNSVGKLQKKALSSLDLQFLSLFD